MRCGGDPEGGRAGGWYVRVERLAWQWARFFYRLICDGKRKTYLTTEKKSKRISALILIRHSRGTYFGAKC